MKRGAYYNENDPYCVQWLRNLIKAGLIADGDVDDRDIRLVKPEDVRGYRQAHFFAGIGGWSYALRLAQWPDDCEVWTGSCPCQPFSAAGKRRGTADARHLWPEFSRLLEEYKPPVAFGEQVASPLGRGWLSRVRVALEDMAYGVGAADLCSASVGAPHIRQRLYWVAVAEGQRWNRGQDSAGPRGRPGSQDGCGVGFTYSPGWPKGRFATQAAGHWSSAVAASCRDGKWRRVEPGIQCVADGIPAVVDKLRAFGNAIDPRLAAVFIEAAREAMTEQLYEVAA